MLSIRNEYVNQRMHISTKWFPPSPPRHTVAQWLGPHKTTLYAGGWAQQHFYAGGGGVGTKTRYKHGLLLRKTKQKIERIKNNWGH